MWDPSCLFWTQDIWYVIAIKGAEDAAAKLGIQLLTRTMPTTRSRRRSSSSTRSWGVSPRRSCRTRLTPPGRSRASRRPMTWASRSSPSTYCPIYATTKLDGLVVLDTVYLGDIACKAVVKAVTDKNGSATGTSLSGPTAISPRMRRHRNSRWLVLVHGAVPSHQDPRRSVRSGQWDPALSATNGSAYVLASHPETDAITLDSDFLATGTPLLF